MLRQLQLTELLVVKISHDLSGVLGAISNGVELLMEDNSMQRQSTQLIDSSAKDAVYKLLFFRYAYGVVNNDTDIDLVRIKKILADLFLEKKITLEWGGVLLENSEEQVVHGKFVKLLLNFAYVVSQMIIGVGKLILNAECKDGLYRLHVSGEGGYLKYSEEDLKLLQGHDSEETPNVKNIAQYFVSVLVKEFKVQVEVRQEEGRISFQVNNI